MSTPVARTALAPCLVLTALFTLVGAPSPARDRIVSALAPQTQTSVTLSGTVRDPSGAAISGATVSAMRPGRHDVLGTATTDASGVYRLPLLGVDRPDSLVLLVRRVGFGVRRTTVAITGDRVRADFVLTTQAVFLEDVVTGAAPAVAGSVVATPAVAAGDAVSGRAAALAPAPMPTFAPLQQRRAKVAGRVGSPRHVGRSSLADDNREQYDRIDDNPFVSVAAAPRSTFSLDVDRASYANVRRFLRDGTRPPADAVRLEEFVNYFPYHDAPPTDGEALAITTEVAPAPWRPSHHLVRVALQARRPDAASRPPSNLVFLVDVSGSMFEPDKLPLVKQALGVLVGRLRPVDRVALVTYAGNAGLVLPSTSGEEKARILAAIDHLEAGGSTAGGAGLDLAYRVARENARPGANSRVILATDGDFNVGPSSDAAMERLIESKRSEGTYLTVLGFGEGNLQDAKMKKLAKRGNGNYAYVDDLAEAEKVFGQELGGTLVTVANDAKLQVEFNPAVVRSYRLLGYEGRLLRDEDFTDDATDAGDVGEGHAVTALYEVVPVSAPAGDTARGVTPLRYAGASDGYPQRVRGRSELLYVQLRYKRPGEPTSRLVTRVAYAPNGRREGGPDFRFASAVAEFGMLLRGSVYRGEASVGQVLGLARGAIGDDPGGHRAEFVRLVERWGRMEDVAAAGR